MSQFHIGITTNTCKLRLFQGIFFLNIIYFYKKIKGKCCCIRKNYTSFRFVNIHSHLSKVFGNVKKSLYNQSKPYFFKKLLWSHFWIDFNKFYTKTFRIVYILIVYLLIMFMMHFLLTGILLEKKSFIFIRAIFSTACWT